MKYFILFILIILSCSPPVTLTPISLQDAAKVILKSEGPEEFFYWEIEDDESLWSTQLTDVAALMQYRDSLKLALGYATYEKAIATESTQALNKAMIATAEDGDRTNALLVHTDSIGRIRPINHLEAQILNYQINRYPMFSKPTEFHVFITRNEKLGKLRVYFGASDTEWPPRPRLLIEDIEKDENKDWKLYRHLHNHYCKKDKDYVGILAPSLADAQYFKMLKERFQVGTVLITNGFHTVEVDSTDFEKFESH